LLTLKIARLLRAANVIWVPTPGIVPQVATAYAFVRLKILGVFAIQVLRLALATRTPTAIVDRELNAFVPVLVTAILLPPAFAIRVLRARVTPVQRARVASVRPVPVQGCALVIRVPIVCAVQAPIATVAKVQSVPVQSCVLVVRVPIVCAAQAPIATVAKVHSVPVQNLIVTAVRVPIVCVVLVLHVPVWDCVPVPLARSVHAVLARHVLVSPVRPAPVA